MKRLPNQIYDSNIAILSVFNKLKNKRKPCQKDL